ncbi:MAG: C-terminal helicase domain-containing protein, partial [Candidatus Marsarchaeota archaeon]|nr:C-terminal helicase domain-containing protein [Candidatus Marsarchaeota archaeon]
RLSSDALYPYDQLSSGIEPKDRTCPWERWALPVIWYSTSEMADRGEEWDEIVRSRYNLREVRIIEEQLKLLENELPESDEPVTVGVISGYAAQAELISRRLGANDDGRWKKISIEINTVDAFQGRDRDIVFYSVVRSNTERKIGHLEDCRRLNVALSRARRLLFVVGDHEMVEFATTREANPFRQVLAHIREHPSECMLLEARDGTA